MSGEDLKVVNNEAAGRFEVRLGDEVAFAEYRLLATGVLFPHTEVPPAFEGQGWAARWSARRWSSCASGASW